MPDSFGPASAWAMVRADEESTVSNWVVVLALLAVAGTASTFSLVTINWAKDVAAQLAASGQAVSTAKVLAELGPADALLAALTLLALSMLAGLEWRGRAVSRFLRTATRLQALAALTILAAWLGYAYLSPGVLLGGDNVVP
ncbi:MAG: hypothetical protein JOY71_03085 [Acetobacteraceae bacterium]|nr:hypothetical protein [Acetobacteraceae bacterium]